MGINQPSIISLQCRSCQLAHEAELLQTVFACDCFHPFVHKTDVLSLYFYAFTGQKVMCFQTVLVILSKN